MAQQPHFWDYVAKGIEHTSWKRRPHPIFIAPLFTIATTWKQPKCPYVGEWMKRMWYTYNGILLGREQGRSSAVFDNMGESRGHCAKWNNSDRDRQIPYNLIYTRAQKQKHRKRDPMCHRQRQGGDGDAIGWRTKVVKRHRLAAAALVSPGRLVQRGGCY